MGVLLMLTVWRADRSARYASVCAMACAVVCASVSASVLLSLLWTSPRAGSVGDASGQWPLVTAGACGDARASAVLARLAERDVRWREARDGVRWGDWRVIVGAEQLPVRVAIAVVAPSGMSLRRVEGDEVDLSLEADRGRAAQRANRGGATAGWTIAQAPASASLAVGVSRALGDITGHVAPSDLVTASSGLALVSGSGEITDCAAPTDTARDRRLAAGMRSDGALIFVLAHFDGVGAQSAMAQLGPTRTELSMLLRALGATQGTELSAGGAAQLLVRQGDGGEQRRWPGMSATAFGLVVERANAVPRVDAGDMVGQR